MSSNRPIDPPTTQPDESPAYPMLINGEWIVILVGLLDATRYKAYWNVSEQDWPDLEGRIDRMLDILQHPD